MRPNAPCAALILCIAVVLQPYSGRAQAPRAAATVTPGTRVRVTAPGALTPSRQAGRVLTTRADTLSLQPDDSVTVLTLPWTAITDLEVSRGQHRSTLNGAFIGALVGGVSGAVIGAATYEKSKPSGGCGGTQEFCISGPLFDIGRSGSAALAGALGAVVGGVTGALIGHAHQRETWEKVPLRLQPALLPTRPTLLGAAAAPGATLSLALRF
jgi:hypothetical protein